MGMAEDEKGGEAMTKKCMTPFLSFLILFLAAFSFENQVDPIKVKVLKVITGDTVEVQFFSDASIEKIRVIGMNAPKSNAIDENEKDFAKVSHKRAQELVENKILFIRLDKTNKLKQHRNSKGQLEAHILLDKKSMFAEKMIYEGLGRFDSKRPFEKRLMKKYEKAENKAKKMSNGLWGPNPILKPDIFGEDDWRDYKYPDTLHKRHVKLKKAFVFEKAMHYLENRLGYSLASADSTGGILISEWRMIDKFLPNVFMKSLLGTRSRARTKITMYIKELKPEITSIKIKFEMKLIADDYLSYMELRDELGEGAYDYFFVGLGKELGISIPICCYGGI